MRAHSWFTVTVHCTCTLSLYTVHVHCQCCHCLLSLYMVHFILALYAVTAHCTLALYTVTVHCHCTLHTVHCTLYTVHCTLYIVLCTLYSPRSHRMYPHTQYVRHNAQVSILALYTVTLHSPVTAHCHCKLGVVFFGRGWMVI